MEHRGPNRVKVSMRRIEFDVPVQIAFGEAGRSRVVRSVVEAVDCLKSEKWPTRRGPMTRMATKALEGAKIGQITAGEARQAFADAALEAHILMPGDKIH